VKVDKDGLSGNPMFMSGVQPAVSKGAPVEQCKGR